MLIDVHCHCNLFLAIDEIIKEASIQGVKKIISVGMSASSLKRVLEISNQYDQIYPALGIHPEEVRLNKNIENQLDSIIKFIKENRDHLCAVGEIGIDHYFIKEKEFYPLQQKIFRKMLVLAQELALPVDLHTKGAEKLIFELLPSYKIPHINIHWYSGPETYLKMGIDRGYYFSITPALKYSTAVRKVVLNIDKEHLLLESDGPVEYSGTIGTPAMLREVLKLVSKIKKIHVDELEHQIEKNTQIIFSRIF